MRFSITITMTNPDRFAYDGPWWHAGAVVVGGSSVRTMIEMAVCADSESQARQIALDACGGVDDMEITSIQPRDFAWSPFDADHEQEDWMQWPHPGLRYPEHAKLAACEPAREAIRTFLRELRKANIELCEFVESRFIPISDDEGRLLAHFGIDAQALNAEHRAMRADDREVEQPAVS